ncbi:N-acetyltransferase DgcN [Balneatrix alpica]|uniref:N-acetyltransferase DgcN n=1 Tax=Balneatrix alpica TaxID=75684 RepID=UPI002738C3F2|nr:N-acetyltransferase DgcN [Balneatrix alpica]
MNVHQIKAPYLLFVGDAEDLLMAKTAKGVAHWRPENSLGQLRFPEAKADLGLPDMDVATAAAAGAKTLIIGLAPMGNSLPPSWIDVCIQALEAGMDVASGLHLRLTDVPDIVATAQRTGGKIHDVRTPPANLPCGTGLPRTGKRLLTVGTDCCVGKMFTALAIHKEMQAQGMDATFRATGQTGIFIAGQGISVDAVVSDFISGSVELLAPAAAHDEHWDVIEGQGSLLHPAYAGVSLGLLHGSQADVLVVCHEAGRVEMDMMPGYDVPSLEETIEINLRLASRTNAKVRLGGIALNTSRYSEAEALQLISEVQQRFAVPVIDPVRTGVAAIVEGLRHG